MDKALSGRAPATPATGAATRGKGDQDFRDTTAAESIWNRTPWNWLVSLRVGIVLLAILTLASIFGTLIDPLERAQKLVFYTWWFKGLLLLLTVNMVCATLRTLSRKVLPPLSTWIRRNPQFFEAAEPSASLRFEGNADTVASALRRHGFETVATGDYGYAIKGRLSRWGTLIAHFGFVVVLLSGFAASWVAREGYIQIVEGQSTDSLVLRGDEQKEIPLGCTVRVDDFETGFFPRTQIPSHYVSTITATKNGKTLYHGPVEVNHSPVIEGWTFHQTSYQEFPRGQRYKVRIESETLENPVELDLSPGQIRQIPGVEGGTVSLTRSAPLRWEVAKGDEVVAEGKLGSAAGASASGYQLRADQFEPDFVMGQNRTITSRSDKLNNPALHIELLDGGQVVASQWLFGREDMKAMMHGGNDLFQFELLRVTGAAGHYIFEVAVDDAQSGTPVGHFSFGLNEAVSLGVGEGPETADTASGESDPSLWTVSIVDRVPLYSTLLTLSRNPLIPVIYGACTLMMVGLGVGFFLTRKEVWFRINPKKNLLQVAAAYRYSREEFDAGMKHILQELTGEKSEGVEKSKPGSAG